MSEYMLDDYNQINDINPFVLKDFSLPGSRSASGDFAPHKEQDDEKTQWDTPYESPACSMPALGDKTVSFCDPVETTCPMSRPLLPEQLFDPGMWNYYPKKRVTKKDGFNWFLIALVAFIALILLSFSRR